MLGSFLQVSLITWVMQVVVDSDATAKALLSNGQLRNRVTIIPLNKVSLQSYAFKYTGVLCIML